MSNPSRLYFALLLAAVAGLVSPRYAGAQMPTPAPNPMAAAPTRADLLAGFKTPPIDARPRGYWWWLEGNVTKASITRDLEQMKAKGYAGAILFDAGSSSYQGMARTPAGPVFGSPKWTELFVHTLKEADRLGLEISLSICSGWNPGGPCVTADDAMKHMVISQAPASGPKHFEGVLPPPAKGEGYHDISVQAFRLRGAAAAGPVEKPEVTASSAQPEHPAASILAGGKDVVWVSQDGPSAAKPQWLQIAYPKPMDIASFHVAGREGYGPREFELLVSADGKAFKSAGKFKLAVKKKNPTQTFKITPVKARALKLVITASFDRGTANAAPRNVQVVAFGPGPLAARAAASGISHWPEKSLTKIFGGVGSGVGADDNVAFLDERESADPASAEVEPDSLVDLTAKMDQAGKLAWNVPAGDWVIVRYGYAPLPTARVSTGSAGWSGYSFDHLNKAAVERHLKAVIDPMLKAAGPLAGQSLKYLYTDSWEMGSPNWTSDFAAQFKTRRGYDIAPWMPVLAGRVVGSADRSNRFLYDFRQTVGELIAENYYQTLADYARAHGLAGTHCEAGGPHGHPVDALRCFGKQEFMQSEFWPRCNTHRVSEAQRYFVKQAASAAHIYGKTWVAAEGPTTIGPHWERPPRDLKDAFDKVFCEGLNRLVWHTFTNSPQEYGLPGNEYFAGTHLNPNVTWWEQAPALIDYISRTSYLLSRGRFAADVAVYVGDDVPAFGTQKHEVEGLGAGYDYDDVNAEVILKRMTVNDGLLTLPDGMQYRALILPNRKAISLEVLKKIAELVRGGATVVGPRPATSTGLAGYPASEKEVQALAAELWGKIDGKTVTANRVGEGRVLWGQPLREAFSAGRVGPDFAFKSALPDTWLDSIHRRLDDGTEIYYVINRLGWHDTHDTDYRYRTDLPDRYEEVEASFRVSGAVPELWDPLTGKATPLAAWREEGGCTRLPLRLNPYGSAFVIFRKATQPETHLVEVVRNGRPIFPVAAHKPGAWPEVALERREGHIIAEVYEGGAYTFKNDANQISIQSYEPLDLSHALDGPWKVNFGGWMGGPSDLVTFDKLISWTESKDDRIKFFSGTASYRKTFRLPETATSGRRVWLDLGNVLELADVRLNGKQVGVSWIAPYRLDVTNYLIPGENDLEIKVVNMWPNRLIGDAGLPEEKRVTQTNVRKFKPGDPLRPSGLLGPVRLVPVRRFEVKF